MDEKIIGIVGGVGPFAGLDLQRKIAGQTIAHKDQEHLTVLSLSRPSDIPDRTEYLLGRVAQNPAFPLAAQVKLLAQMGARVVGIPCNTAHAFPIWDVLQRELGQTDGRPCLLHMIVEVGRFLQTQAPAVHTVGILSTSGTYQAGTYPQVLKSAGFTAVTPTPAMQENQIHPAIYHPQYGIKARGFVTPQARANLLAGVAALQAQGAQAVLLGCTEIPLAITEREVDGTPMIDPTLILARALVREANPAKLRPWPVAVGP